MFKPFQTRFKIETVQYKGMWPMYRVMMRKWYWFNFKSAINIYYASELAARLKMASLNHVG